VDLLCEPDLQPFYSKLGMQPAAGMLPVLEPRPWTTLADRIIAQCGSARRG
jgi:hypothetical protein